MHVDCAKSVCLRKVSVKTVPFDSRKQSQGDRKECKHMRWGLELPTMPENRTVYRRQINRTMPVPNVTEAKWVDKQRRPRAAWSGVYMISIQTSILWLPALKTNIFLKNKERENGPEFSKMYGNSKIDVCIVPTNYIFHYLIIFLNPKSILYLINLQYNLGAQCNYLGNRFGPRCLLNYVI